MNSVFPENDLMCLIGFPIRILAEPYTGNPFISAKDECVTHVSVLNFYQPMFLNQREDFVHDLIYWDVIREENHRIVRRA
jgi:hypothetical protein